jgi:hypothetical protein
MTRIIDLESVANPQDSAVVVVTDAVSSKKVTVSDLRNTLIKTASTTQTGTVKIGSGLRIDQSGTLSVINFSGYTLPPATQIQLGGVIVGNGLSVSSTGLLSVDIVAMPRASNSTFGIVKIGTGLTVQDGVLSNPVTQYVLPSATQAILGGVKVGEGLRIDQSVLSVKKSIAIEGNQTINDDNTIADQTVSYSVSPVAIGKTSTITVENEATWTIYSPVEADELDLSGPIKEYSQAINFDYYVSDETTAVSYSPITVNRTVSVEISPLSAWIIF